MSLEENYFTSEALQSTLSLHLHMQCLTIAFFLLRIISMMIDVISRDYSIHFGIIKT